VTTRDYSTISPSARGVLALRSLSPELPFASFAAAEELFTEAGFAITRREGASPIRQTWMLEPG